MNERLIQIGQTLCLSQKCGGCPHFEPDEESMRNHEGMICLQGGNIVDLPIRGKCYHPRLRQETGYRWNGEVLSNQVCETVIKALTEQLGSSLTIDQL